MAAYEYMVIPAPTKGVKAKGIKTVEGRFALALQDVMNKMGVDGWEYQRAETLPSVERSGLTGSTTNWRHVLVFRRVTHDDAAQTSEIAEEFPTDPQPEWDDAPEHDDPERPAGQPGATRMFADDGVEEISDVSDVTTSLETLAEARKNT